MFNFLFSIAELTTGTPRSVAPQPSHCPQLDAVAAFHLHMQLSSVTLRPITLPHRGCATAPGKGFADGVGDPEASQAQPSVAGHRLA